MNPDWAYLPPPALQPIYRHLSRLLAAAGPLSVWEAFASAHSAPCRIWQDSAKKELLLDVWCSGSRSELLALLRLACCARLCSLHLRHPPESDSLVFELLAHAAFVESVGPHLRVLEGAPASLASGKHTLHPLPLAAYPGLESLHLAVPSHRQVLSLRANGEGWETARALRRLSISGRHYVALRVLPPHLHSLAVTAWHILIEPQILVHCPRVELSAAAVLLSDHVMPYAGLAGAAGTAAVEAQLSDLAALLATAGLPAGHSVHFTTNLVCFQRASDNSEAKLVPPSRQADADPADGAGADADRDGANGGAAAAQHGMQEFAALAKQAGGVTARMAPPALKAAWPTELGPGPAMHLLLACT